MHQLENNKGAILADVIDSMAATSEGVFERSIPAAGRCHLAEQRDTRLSGLDPREADRSANY
jgi:hypothetical protein